MNDKIKILISKFKEPKYLLIMGLLGIVLISLPTIFGLGKSKVSSQSESFDNESYRDELQKSVGSIVKGITGDKKATVVVTLESGVRYSYADDIKTDTDLTDGEKTTQTRKSSESSHITVKSSAGDEKALIITENMPEIRGVAIICSGGDNEEIREKIEKSVMAALNITSKRVYITGKTD